MRALLLAMAALFALSAAAVATPLACTSNCTVTASASTGYDLPVFEVESGSSMVWHSADVTHVQADGTIGSVAPCIRVASFGHQDSAPVRFDIVNSAVQATTGSGSPSVCANAEGTPAGSYVLPYYCILHPSMRGVLVVSP